MEKPLIFISHITEEKDLALSFKKLIESSFLGMIEVFVSSDENSIALGERWLDNISSSLKKCKIELILCSPKSIKRPWINFEAGAGWVREISVIPLCHSGMKPSNLPMPLNLLQAIEISSISNLKLLFPVIAQAIGSAIPNVDFTDFIAQAKELEKQYSFWNDCNEAFDELNSINPEIIQKLKNGQNINTNLRETQISRLEEVNNFFLSNNILKLERTGGSVISPNGMFHGFRVTILTGFNQIISDVNFKY